MDSLDPARYPGLCRRPGMDSLDPLDTLDFADDLAWTPWTQLHTLDFADDLAWTPWTQLHTLDFADDLAWTPWTQLHTLDFADDLAWTPWTQLDTLGFADDLAWTPWTQLHTLDFADDLDPFSHTQQHDTRKASTAKDNSDRLGLNVHKGYSRVLKKLSVSITTCLRRILQATGLRPSTTVNSGNRPSNIQQKTRYSKTMDFRTRILLNPYRKGFWSLKYSPLTPGCEELKSTKRLLSTKGKFTTILVLATLQDKWR